jgi:hypothetical protein
MVKNTTGGSKHKSFSRKSNSLNNNNNLILPSLPLELFAIVHKLLGNGLCIAFTSSLSYLLCHIRNKFKGKFKKPQKIEILFTGKEKIFN